MIIGLSGYIGCGKDTIGRIIQTSTAMVKENSHGIDYTSYTWQIKKFASKLKQIASILTGIPAEKFEDQDFKKTYLPREWGRTLIDGDGVSGTIPMTVREFLQRLGTEAIRDNTHTNAWVNALFADYKATLDISDGVARDKWPDWIITDCRFPNEAEAIKDRGGMVVRIDRRLPTAPYQTLEQRHPSETSLDSWIFDYIINNNGTIEELTGKVKKMLEEFNI